MHTSRFHCFLLLTMVLVLTGCSSPKTRIRDNRAMFNAFTKEQQELVYKGEVRVGFTPEMVYIAKGHPDRKYKRTTQDGESEIWSYVRREYWSEPQRVNFTYRVHDLQGRSRSVTDSETVNVQQEREYEKFRIEFVDGVVLGLEELLP